MVYQQNIKVTSCNNKQNNNTTKKINLNTNNNTNYKLCYPQNKQERWIVKQIKLLYSKLSIAHFNILEINSDERKELFEELLIKYKKYFGKEYIIEKEEENNNNFNKQNEQNEQNKKNKRITIINTIQSYVEDSSDDDVLFENCNKPILDNDKTKGDIENNTGDDTEDDTENYIKGNINNKKDFKVSDNSEKEIKEKELKKLLGIDVNYENCIAKEA